MHNLLHSVTCHDSYRWELTALPRPLAGFKRPASRRWEGKKRWGWEGKEGSRGVIRREEREEGMGEKGKRGGREKEEERGREEQELAFRHINISDNTPVYRHGGHSFQCINSSVPVVGCRYDGRERRRQLI